MKDAVYVVRLNDFEVGIAAQMEPVLRKLGKNYRWKEDIIRGYELKFHIEDVTKDKIVLTGQFGVPKFRLKIAGNGVAFTTVNAVAPEAIFYDMINLIMGQHDPDFLSKQMVPQTYDMVSTDPNDYFIMNNSYTDKISEYFRQVLAAKEYFDYRNGLFYFDLATVDWGNEQLRAYVKEFAEKSYYNEVIINVVFHRGHCIPLFYGNGAVFCPAVEKDYFETLLEDFTRIFMKFANPNKEAYNLNFTRDETAGKME